MASQPTNSTNNSANAHHNSTTELAVPNDVWINFAPYWHVQCGRTNSNKASRFRNRKCGNSRMNTRCFLNSIAEKEHQRIREIKQIAKKFLQGYQDIGEPNMYAKELINNNVNNVNGYTQIQKESILNQFDKIMRELVIEVIDLDAPVKGDDFNCNSTTKQLKQLSKHQFNNDGGNHISNDSFAHIYDKLKYSMKMLIKQNEQLIKQNQQIVCYPKFWRSCFLSSF